MASESYQQTGSFAALLSQAITHPILACFLLTSLLTFTYAFYNAHLHPLRKYPGPLLWRSFRIPYVIATQRGIIHQRFTSFHAKYGPIVRVAPNELSYADSRALKDIYANRPGHLLFERNPTSFKKMEADEPNSILYWHEGDHARYRRAFANSFSEKALREQAPVIEGYVDLFIEQLKKRKKVDLTQWLNYLLFDLSGDLTYGESWRCLEKGEAHPWVEISSDFGKGLALIASVNAYPPVHKLLRFIIPKRIVQRSMDHRQMSHEQAQRRIARDDDRPDWVTPAKKYSELKDHFTDKEWWLNLLVLAFAGSETTASALTAILRLLVQHKGVLHRLAAEIRDTFEQETDITISSTGNLPYLNAVIDEGLRLGPPVVIGVPRVVPKGGDTICDRWVPEGTYVTFNQFSAYRQSYNFPNPNSFIPERFLSSPPSKPSTDPSQPSVPPADLAIFYPFQLGRHSCIGQKLAYQEMRLVLARLLWSFDIRLEDESDCWDWGEQETYFFWDKKALSVVLDEARAGGDK
ncbi:benzoate 4-monooxygenase cytochrome P450 [Pyrenophora tritici-repentis]|nr:benzoate 4-monooxygenase cytochrome P450 [Pyrenophora tritici-repentis]